MTFYNKNSQLKIIIFILILEKIVQHIITSIFFIYTIPGIGTPNIGSNFKLDNNTMTLFNFTYAILFVVAFVLFLKNNLYSLYVIVFLSFLDIFFEFLFHGIGYITVSVVIATFLIILSYKNYSIRANFKYINSL